MALELYEKYRDEEGYIDLTQAEKDGIFSASTLRHEPRGSDRGVGLSKENYSSALKGWFDFSTSQNGQTETFLVRTNMFRGDESNYTDYAELIFEEVAKEVGIRSPHYDLFKYNGEKGVLSQKLTKANETMTSLDSNLPHSYQAGVKLSFVDELIAKTLRFQGKSKDAIEKLQEELRKIVILDVLTLNEDRHLGNITFISNPDTGEISLGIYDNEISFLLSNPKGTIVNSYDIETYADISSTVLHGDYSDSAVDTVTEIMDEIDMDDDSSSTLVSFLCKSAQLDMNKIFRRIENRIHAPIPTQAKNIAKLAYKSKVHELDNELYLSAYPNWNSQYNIGGEDR